MGILDLFSQIVWTAAGLSVFAAVVLFLLPYLWEVWMEAKPQLDEEKAMYALTLKALDTYRETGEPVAIYVGVDPNELETEDDDDSEQQQETKSKQRLH